MGLQSMSDIPTIEITSTGVSIPDASDLFDGALADENDSFGGNLNITDVGTPQYYRAQSIAQAINNQNAAIASYINQVDPMNAEGRMQEAIGRIYFMTRKPATASTVAAQLNGSIGVTISAGAAIAKDDAGYYWANSGDFTFDSNGTATVSFACQTKGSISLGIGQLTSIAVVVSGWDAITNLVVAAVGSDVETTSAFEIRRRESVAKNANGSPAAIRSAIWDIDDVLDVYVYDNFTGSAITYGATNYSIPAHTVYVAVEGGLDSSIGSAIAAKKSSGCSTVGNTTVTIVDDSGNVAYPYPTYTYNFNRPTSTPILFEVQIKNSTKLPSDIVAQTKAAITATFNGTDGSDRARIGGDIYASTFYYGVAQISKAVSVISILVGTSTATLNSVSMGIDQYPTISDSNISVVLV